jgi:four helix bundle protein
VKREDVKRETRRREVVGMTFEEWVSEVPEEIKGDSLWKVEAYRLALFMSDMCWSDVIKLVQDKRTLDLSDQLYRATGSIGANIAEGYSRSTGKDRARFYEYALGSARESRDWYYKARYVLSQEVSNHRMNLVTQIIRLLITTIPQQRAHGTIREPESEYIVNLDHLLNRVPMP